MSAMCQKRTWMARTSKPGHVVPVAHVELSGMRVRRTLISRPEFRFALSRLHAGALRALGLSAGDLRRHRFIGAAQDDDLVELAVLVSL
jgi:hypothetical protein